MQQDEINVLPGIVLGAMHHESNTDCIARYGGEEFVILLKEAERAKALIVAEKIRALVERTRFHYQNQVLPVTISLGVTEVRPDDKDPEAIFRRVDAAVHQAKKEGKNRACLG
jgi:diguanylate cyclase (GGDEF)-like protein